MPRTVLLTFKKETPNKIVFAEVKSNPTEPDVIPSVYIPKSMAGNARNLKVTIDFLP